MSLDPVVPQFITGDYKTEPVFLEDREYALALDALVKACSDILVCSADSNSVLLGKRKVEPQPDWWFIGGRARPGDSTRQAAVRNIWRELGLNLSVDRFFVISTYSFVWQFRQQDPIENGTADISTIHCLKLLKEEESLVKLDLKEYSDSQYFSLDDILSGEFHPALKQAVRDLKKKRALDTLYSVADSDGDERSIADAAISYVKCCKDSDVVSEVQKVRFVDKGYQKEVESCETDRPAEAAEQQPIHIKKLKKSTSSKS